MTFLGFFDPTQRKLKAWKKRVSKINELEDVFTHLSSQELRTKTVQFRQRLRDGAPLDSLLEEAFAAVREAGRRTLAQRHFDVQLLGGMALHFGKIAEMYTGEGKTLAATTAAYLNALEGKGVHVVTVNDYLARRDAVWMGQIYDALGLTIGCLTHDQAYRYDPSVMGEEIEKMRDQQGGFLIVQEFLRPVSRREAYEADITYGTNHEFGFDYLRDNLVLDKNQRAQRLPGDGGLHFAIVDEVDSILIDEARTPLIISVPERESPKLYAQYHRVVRQLKQDADFHVDEKRKTATLTEEGIDKLSKILGLDIFSAGLIREIHHLQESLRANYCFHKDKDYVIKDGQVIIVDPFTGRLMHGRRWSGGLHQAVEAKEGVRIQEESRTVATITLQNYFRMYRKLSGMTGTAQTSGEEFHKVYNLEVITIPTNRPMVRVDHIDRVYMNEKAKYNAIVKEVRARQQKGQPVLVGSISVEKNEIISGYFRQAGIEHEILNAKNHEREGQIIAQAGKAGRVTVATNMAGRGVDIILGGNPQDPAEAEKIKNAGGLFVLGTERHESRRIDNQLRGRSGRQGDPGESQFFISLEDDLTRIFGSEKLKNFAFSLGFPEDQPLEHSFISRAISQAQQKVEGFNFDVRKHLLDYDDVLNRQRRYIYGLRNKILFGEIEPEVFLKERIQSVVDYILSQPYTEQTGEMIKSFFNLKEIPKELEKEKLLEDIQAALEEKKQKFGAEPAGPSGGFALTIKFLSLRIIDALWQEHLEFLEHFRDAAGLRAYGQRDPLVEYRSESYKAFKDLQRRFDEALVSTALKLERADVRLPQQTSQAHADFTRKNAENIPRQSVSDQRSSAVGKVGRNDPCPCGAKKPDGTPVKFKKCHGR